MQGIASLRGYQRGGITSLDPEEKRRRRLWQLMAERRDAPESTDEEEWGGEILTGIRRLKPLFFGERSKTGYVPGVSEAIYNTVTPDYEEAHFGQMADALKRIARGDFGDIDDSMAQRMGGPLRMNREGEPMKPRRKGEEDAWRMYLGLPQASGTFQESEYRPTIGSGEDIRYRDFSEPHRVIDTLVGRRARGDEPLAGFDPEAPFTERERESLRRAYAIEDLVKEMGGAGGSVLETDTMGFGGDVMGDYTLGMGEDEKGSYLSYYDKWDLAPKVAQISRAGQPFDIYGRMYYDPETYEYLDPNSAYPDRETLTSSVSP